MTWIEVEELLLDCLLAAWSQALEDPSCLNQYSASEAVIPSADPCFGASAPSWILVQNCCSWTQEVQCSQAEEGNLQGRREGLQMVDLVFPGVRGGQDNAVSGLREGGTLV